MTIFFLLPLLKFFISSKEGIKEIVIKKHDIIPNEANMPNCFIAEIEEEIFDKNAIAVVIVASEMAVITGLIFLFSFIFNVR